ncbi:hypothetical protein PAMP_006349 [Pampus punctatissimus]
MDGRSNVGHWAFQCCHVQSKSVAASCSTNAAFQPAPGLRDALYSSINDLYQCTMWPKKEEDWKKRAGKTDEEIKLLIYHPEHKGAAGEAEQLQEEKKDEKEENDEKKEERVKNEKEEKLKMQEANKMENKDDEMERKSKNKKKAKKKKKNRE